MKWSLRDTKHKVQGKVITTRNSTAQTNKEVTIYGQRLRKQYGSSNSVPVTSLGLVVFLENVQTLFFEVGFSDVDVSWS